MVKAPRPFSITITQTEANEILTPHGAGGQQQFHDLLRNQLANGNLTILLDDADLGKLVRYMTQYGSGGFQGRLKKAFTRALRDIIK
jgi:hypothetical protein